MGHPGYSELDHPRLAGRLWTVTVLAFQYPDGIYCHDRALAQPGEENG